MRRILNGNVFARGSLTAREAAVGLLLLLLGGCGPGTVKVEEAEALTAGASVVRSGPWRLVSGSVSADPCMFDGLQVSAFFFVVLESFIPRNFEVTGTRNGFEIIALNVGARAPVLCLVEGERFSCETQSARPFGIDDPSWQYDVDFEGEVVDVDTIRGTAVVQYVSFEASLLSALEESGVDLADCNTVVEMELQRGTW